MKIKLDKTFFVRTLRYIEEKGSMIFALLYFYDEITALCEYPKDCYIDPGKIITSGKFALWLASVPAKIYKSSGDGEYYSLLYLNKGPSSSEQINDILEIEVLDGAFSIPETVNTNDERRD